ncbi:hypothetical protein B0H13DRAFT_2318649 [Mycena leptocephala]|nr:hypothetical protein B0H13DRAFT_2318649 [Mycena leptocephala]
MDYAWCFGSGDWAQTQSDPTGTGGFFDENINHLQWNSSTCNTPAPLVPDSTPFTFGLEMGPGVNERATFFRWVFVCFV